MKIGDKVKIREVLTDYIGTIIKIENGYFKAEANGHTHEFFNHEYEAIKIITKEN